MYSASENLEGLQTNDGWNIVKIISRAAHLSGGTFSRGYRVEKDGRQGFLKAFDFKEAFQPGVNAIDRMQELLSMYTHERDLLKICGDKKLSNVVIAIGHGDIQVPTKEGMEGRAYYLIFELADTDVRIQVDSTSAQDAIWSLEVFFQVTLGLWQVHKLQIAHQDVKPSNVLIYGKNKSKVSDFGRASHMHKPALVDSYRIAGDSTYAPPELLYGHIHADFSVRRFGCDLYMLGNIAVFLFAGLNVTSSLFTHLAPQFHKNVWQGKFHDVLPYLQRAFGEFIVDLEKRVDPLVKDEIVSLAKELCNPDPEKRGTPKLIGKAEQYSLERYVSRVNHLRMLVIPRMRTQIA